ncbi:MAG: DUF302 domain-containing protein [Burkholderiales bacterium]
MKKSWMIWVAGLLSLFVSIAHADDKVIVPVKGSFDAVKDSAVMAITNRGIVINNISHVGNMLVRTGKDLGDTKGIYGTAEVLEFCSAVVSRHMMEADHANIIYCPYTIAVYTLPGEPGKTYLSYRKPPQDIGSPATRKAMGEVEKLLHDIVTEASQSVM